ncbi:non-ribosomal peptide synthetase [Streptomyces sp. NPDC056400]|uniref:non-ribosomal peptide synthetase n=1 Tax=Streptomyces sp. NPDC056400 TaxID=3345808 RepID=UPI0035DDCF4D
MEMSVPYRVADPVPSDRGSVGSARACHSLVLHIPYPVSPEELRRDAPAALARTTGLAEIRMWVEPVASATAGEAVRDRLRREAGRPLAPSGPPVRMVLLHHRDGDAHLILTARRAVVNARALRAAASSILSGPQGATEADPAVLPPHPAAGPQQSRPALDWGMGSPERTGRTSSVAVPPLPEHVGDSALVAALALVQHRYSAGESTAVSILNAEGTAVGPSVIGGFFDEGTSAKEFLAQWEGPYGEQPAADGPAPAVGMVLDSTVPGTDYHPFLAPVLPVVVHWRRHRDGTVDGVVWYDEGETAPEVADRFAACVAHVAHQLVSDPDRALGEVELTDDEEARAIVAAGSPPALVEPAGRPATIDGLFSEMARRRPDAVALVDGDVRLSYAELDRRAGLLADGLAETGVAPGSLIGLALEHGADLIVTLLGVLKSGCAYVPMDVRYPRERLLHTAENAGTQVVISEAGGFPGSPGVRVISPAELYRLGARTSAGPGKGPAADGSDVAYVIYTSGSTGRPKGVAVLHRNVTALMSATRTDFGLGPSDVWTFFHSIAFDFSVWEIWGCLLTGGRLVIAPYWVTRDTDLFHELLVRERVTVLSQTPSAFGQLVETGLRSPDALAVRLVVFGGEPLDTRSLLPWFSRYPATHCRLVNMFGITETTVHVTAHTVTPADAVAGSRSVGRALPGWSVTVRDPRGRVLPVGAPGEIWVGGAGVASRYLGQPELTEARFVADPVTGERCYRSGDKGRLRPDGELDHLGRLDNQVKVRGHRIELDEIRHVLLGHPAVTRAAAVLHQETPGDSASARIDAYVVLGDATGTSEVLAHASGVLPAYMMPSTITRVESIPLTINGKLDVAALPRPSVAVGHPRDDAAPPRDITAHSDGLAERILGLWADVLGTDVGAQDNFFELGGNSLLVIRLLREMRNRGLPKVSTQDFYRNSAAQQFIEFVRGAH